MYVEPLKLDEETTALFSQIKFIAFDFDGVFTDNNVYINQDGTEMVKCSRYDGIGLMNLENTGIQKIVISSETNPLVKIRCQKLDIDCFFSVANKIDLLTELITSRRLDLSQVAYMGNDINDLDCLSSVGLPIVVKDCHPCLIKTAKYVTQTLGGYGAVREVCDLLTKRTE